METRHEALARKFIQASWSSDPDWWRSFANAVILEQQIKNPRLTLEKISPAQ